MKLFLQNKNNFIGNTSESVNKKFFMLLRRPLCFEFFTQSRETAHPEANLMILILKLFVF
ncbi:hypothetical protein BV494_14020 [Rahnella sikkimica]|uniref:Uncharacterized protein n=1 Tax=Rahnella sikkimica TaxID=1805933 RepID=A0A2L1USV2_9GAMM|nr:hypothetical protein BV494_14020 [Rahnella sikkimica]